MRRNVAIAAGIAAGVTTLALVTTPALAQNGPWSSARSTTDTTCPMLDGDTAPGSGNALGRGDRQGAGRSMGQGVGMGRGNGMQGGMGMAGATTAASGTLTTSQKTALAGMADEEKLARDVYSVLATRYPPMCSSPGSCAPSRCTSPRFAP
jgi:hypothetical protein